jgi:hypothetical protein
MCAFIAAGMASQLLLNSPSEPHQPLSAAEGSLQRWSSDLLPGGWQTMSEGASLIIPFARVEYAL